MSGDNPARPEKHRFEVLDSLRGLCACAVALYHFRTPGLLANLPPIANGYLFVDFFFVLSGFVISASYGQRLSEGFSIPKFMALRVGRIYPLHIVTLGVWVAFELAFLLAGSADRQPFTGGYSIGTLLATVFLIHIFVCDADLWNPPNWSIAAEVWTYLVATWLFRLPRGLRRLACLAVVAVVPVYLARLTDHYINVTLWGSIARCLYGFCLGMIGYGALPRVRSLLPAGRRAGTAVEIACLLLVIGLTSVAEAGPLSLLGPPLFFLVVLCFAVERGAVSRVLRTRPFLLVGTLSYSIYMVHLFIQLRLVNLLQAGEKLLHRPGLFTVKVAAGNQVGGSPLFGDMMSLVMLALAIGCGWLTWRFIERPGQLRSRELVLGRRPRPLTIAAEREAPTF